MALTSRSQRTTLSLAHQVNIHANSTDQERWVRADVPINTSLPRVIIVITIFLVQPIQVIHPVRLKSIGNGEKRASFYFLPFTCDAAILHLLVSRHCRRNTWRTKINDLDVTTPLKFCNLNYKTLKPRHVKVKIKILAIIYLIFARVQSILAAVGQWYPLKIIYTDYIFQNAIITLSVVSDINLYKPPAPSFSTTTKYSMYFNIRQRTFILIYTTGYARKKKG